MELNELKEKARKSLKGHYKDAIILLIVFTIISAVIGAIGGVLDSSLKTIGEPMEIMGSKIPTAGLFTSIATTIVTALFTFGMLNFFLSISRNKKVTWNELFNKTNLFIDFLVISFYLQLYGHYYLSSLVLLPHLLTLKFT